MSVSKRDGSITFSVNADNSKAVKKLNELEQKIAEVEQEIEEKNQERNGIEKQLNNATAAAERSRQKIKLLNEEMKKSRDTAFEAWTRGDNGTQLEEAQRQKEISAEIERQNVLMEEAAKRMGKLDAELVKVDRSLKNPTKKLDNMKRKAGELTEEITYSKSAIARMKTATAEADARMKKLSDRVKNLAKRVFVFSLITSALRAMKDWLGNVIKSNKDASSAIAKLKGALLTLIQPLVNVIIPAFSRLVNILTYGVTALARVMSALFGTTIEESADAAEGLYNETEALEGVGKAAKQAKNQLASFDEINSLGNEQTSNVIVPDFNVTKLPDWLETWVAKIEAKIGEIRFSLTDEGEKAGKENWNKFILPVLGTIIGGMFGGLKGAVIGLALGGIANLVSLDFTDEVNNEESAKQFKEVFAAIIGAVIGAAIGSAIGGIGGGIIGFALGAIVSLIAFSFKDETDKSDSAKQLKGVTTSILSAIVGFAIGAKLLGGITGGIVGIGLGLMISFLYSKYSNADFQASDATALFKTALTGILGWVIGSVFGGVAGGFIGLLFGLGISLVKASFDEDLSASARKLAQDAALLVLEGILGVIFGAAVFGGFVGGLAGGVIALSLGVLFTFSFATVRENVPNFTGIGPDYSWLVKDKTEEVALETPKLASGTFTPTNRDFLDATTGSPKVQSDLIKLGRQKPAFDGVSGGTEMTVKLYLDGRELAENQVVHINNMTRESGEPVLLT